MSTAAVGNLVVAAYGFSGSDTNLTRIYNTSTNTWSSGATAPGPTSSEGAATSGNDPKTGEGAIFALGGRGGAGTDNNEYIPATNTWKVLTPMPTARDGLGVARTGGSIYAIGGRPQTSGPCTGSGSEMATVERYNLFTGVWTTVASLPSARSDVGAIARGPKIYVFGGCNSDGISSEVDIYDTTTNTWTTGAPMPTPRAGFYGVGMVNGMIYVMGGENAAGNPSPANEVYNANTNTWSSSTPMPHPRGEMGVASVSGSIYTVGGALPAFGLSVDTNDVFRP
jgi:N-acetylneuraminic acid mutarotase